MRQIADQIGTSASYIAFSSVVYKYTPDLVPEVMAGTLSLNDAYKEAKIVKGLKETEDERREVDRQHRAELEANAPDLMEQIDSGDVTFAEAWARYERQQHEEAQGRKQRSDRLYAAFRSLDSQFSGEPETAATDWVPVLEQQIDAPGHERLTTAASLREIDQRFKRFIAAIEEQGGSLRGQAVTRAE